MDFFGQDVQKSIWRGGIRVCGDAVLGSFWCCFTVIFFLTSTVLWFYNTKRFAVITNF